MILKRNLTSETELKEILDFIYIQSKQGKSFHGIMEVAFNEITIVTAIHKVKSNKGAKTSGVDKAKMDKYLQMDKQELIRLIQMQVANYKPKPVKRQYIKKNNGKLRPLGIPTIIDRIIQECLRIVLEPIAEAKFYPHSYGFRPYRATKHAVKNIVQLINMGTNDKPAIVIEGDITGYFDNINHRILLNKLWKIGIHDKRVIAIIRKMLEAGYIEKEMKYDTESGTVQGGIISPLLANIYLNDFDWTIGRMYHHPNRYRNENYGRTRLKLQGVKPKFLIRYCDDWVLMTTTTDEAKRMYKYLTKYFKQRLKLELSAEKTTITDMREESIKFLGFSILAGHSRASPKSPKSSQLVGKPYPDMRKVKRKVKAISKDIKTIQYMQNTGEIAIRIEKVNAMITGLSEYYKTAICSKAFNYIDIRINNSSYAAFKKTFGDEYKKNYVHLSELSNRPNRHKGYKTKTFAVKHDDMLIGITKAFITHSKWEKFQFNQSMTPYTRQGRELYLKQCTAKKYLPLDRPPLYDAEILKYSINSQLNNFEFYMNREYAFNRDKGRCKICGHALIKDNRHCHRMHGNLPIDKINKVPNLVWLCLRCDETVHGNIIPVNADKKTIKKIERYRLNLQS